MEKNIEKIGESKPPRRSEKEFSGLSEEESKELLEELRRLRQEQISGPWGEEKRRRLLELSKLLEKKEEALSPDEEKEYIELTRRQTSSDNWTPQDARRLAELQRRKDRNTPKSNF